MRPALIENCIQCHGPETQENQLRVDSLEHLLRGGERGPGIVPGSPDKSLIVKAIRRQGKLKMPPDGQLSATDIAAIEQWIRTGAPWPDIVTKASSFDGAARLDRIQELRNFHWSFQPIVKTQIPRRPADQSLTPIDSFIRRRLAQARLSPSARADRATLIRRLYFDLIGLPPSFGAVEKFVEAESATAYEQLVDDLLNRPEFGERWARHWLDLARYADTTGYQEGAEARYPFAWTYRDYVVRSFNQDTPYNDFVVEQLAADQLALSEDGQWKLAAMGFLTLGPRFNYKRHDIIDDRIDVAMRGLMGLSVSCARCHDHKYDPVLTEDYYGLYGVFASSREPLYTDLPRIYHSRGKFSRYREFRRQVSRATRRFEQFHARVHRRIQHEMRFMVGDYLRYLVQLMPEHRSVTQPSFETPRGGIRGPTPYGPGAIVRWQHYIDQCGQRDPVFGIWNQLAKLPREPVAEKTSELAAQDKQFNPVLCAELLRERPSTMLQVAAVYGEVLEEVYRQWTDALAADPAIRQLPDLAVEQLRQVLYGPESPISMNEVEAHDCYTDGEFNEFMGRKRELDSLFVEYQDVAEPRAMVMTDRSVPYEPRIFFRGNGNRPTSWVPRRFLRCLSDINDQSFDHGSGRLQLARAIVDLDNPLTARVIVNRLWQWHFGKGLVDTPSDFGTRGTPPSHPHLLDWLAADFMQHGWSLKRLHKQIAMSQTFQQKSVDRDEAVDIDPGNRLLWRMNRRRLEFEAFRDSLLLVAGSLSQRQGGPPVDGLKATCRTLYLTVNRNDLPGVFGTFDFPSPDISNARRPETTVPQQALFLMNSGFVSSIATKIADSLTGQNDQQRCELLFQRIFGRTPSQKELAVCLDFLDEGFQRQKWRDLAQTLLMSNSFVFVD